MPLVTVVIPAFNAQSHLDRAFASIPADPRLEVIVVDDGSTDDTAAVAHRWQREHAVTIRILQQSNRGHGGAIMAGIDAARGTYLKVLDADDWVDPEALLTSIDELAMREPSGGVDLLITDYVHVREGKTPRQARFDSVFPVGDFGWHRVGRFTRRQVLMMHALTYRTELLRSSGLRLPEHTFYVDNLMVVVPLQHARTLAYLPIAPYQYAIGRSDQSVNSEVMVARVDQLLRVNLLAVRSLADRLSHLDRGQLSTLVHYVEGMCAVTCATLARGDDDVHREMRHQFWAQIRDDNPWLYARLRRSLISASSNLPGQAGRRVTTAAYHLARRVVGFS